MWLLDVNLPNGLLRSLKTFGVAADTTTQRGWRNLGNGDLAKAAFNAGFKVILTRDRLFGESAGKALKLFPDLAIVILRITQSRESSFLVAFDTAWKQLPITPVPGSVMEWPPDSPASGGSRSK